MIIPCQKVKTKWNNANKKHYESCGYAFTKNGEEFEIDIKHITKGSKVQVKFKCDWCNETFEREYQIAIRNEHQFCCHDCSVKYNSKIKLEARPWKTCEWCNKSYQVKNDQVEISRFCCRDCMAKWQSETFRGAGSSRYVERIVVKCDWCNKSLERTEYELSLRNYNFCDRECQRNWHREVFVKSEEFLEVVRNVMISNLTDGKISFTNSKPQVMLNEFLTNKGIKFTNEKPIGDFSFDVYLNQFDLLIEVNGGFWHCDNRFYDEINYDMQLNRIISDKRKRTYIKNKLGKPILYLWEFDIETNMELCYKLILEYINNKGKIKDYHSFNYFLDENGDIQLEKELIKPYMDWNAKELTNIVDLSVRENVNRFQPEKHITFNCEYCGNEKTQYVYTYIRSKSHFCSVNCKNLSQQVGNSTDQLRFIHQCANCNKDIEVQNHVHQRLISGEQNNVFCSNECNGQWQSKNKVGKNHPNYSRILRMCENEDCKQEYEVPFSQKERSHYCSVECRQKSSRKRITINCANCNKEIERTPTQYKKNKSGMFFCSYECNNEYKLKENKDLRNCEYCNTEFETKKNTKQRFCCISCRNKGIALEKKFYSS